MCAEALTWRREPLFGVNEQIFGVNTVIGLRQWIFGVKYLSTDHRPQRFVNSTVAALDLP